ncbi:calcitonin gene-related peptide type 1 receptor [Melanotaenia boesemani]|uniref:calcitonin gene-related peptide type 1 receptor n=1 Tax=Melanotaenia boesemani TaxID=1250792 RepID=UPI001C05C93F|nr:calcitonin gene-related peptide type 1 receptor [Melanotaenia boesemani]XP_041823129.1 calcitonin gene-related peptide type 1 receptor [Melanotaenia boesemani]
MRLAGSFWILCFLLVHRMASGESISGPTLSPGPSIIEGQIELSQYKCLELSNKGHRENRTGVFCAHMWDGLLCWDETPAGTSVTQSCPNHPDFDNTEKVTKYCDESGNWVQTSSTCRPALKNQLQERNFSRDAAGEPTTEATRVRKESNILENEKKCFEKMKNDPPYNKSGLHCSRIWDGWLCWEDTPAGTYASQNCPDYFIGFDPTEKATRYCEKDGQWFQHPENKKIWTDYTLCTTTHKKRLGKLKIRENEHRCLQKIKQDPPFNKTGLYCSRNWDGQLCWDDTPAGTYASQSCPDYFSDLKPTEKATKYCGEHGQWFRHPDNNMTWTNYTLCVGNNKESLRAAAQFSRDTEVETTSEATVSSVDNQKEEEERKKILDNQYKCFEKMNRDQPYNKSGLYCSRNWDGWLCWEDTPAGTFTSQNCPNYFDDFDPTEKATKYCGEDGQWFRHPDTNRTWSNYTLCNENTKAKLKSAYILFYMAIVGHALSIASLLISLAIFFYFRSLSCQRITLHKNLFCSYVLNSALTIIYLVTVVNNPKVVARNPVGCKVLHFFHMYMLGCNYFWMLCEGIYLHTLIVVAVFAEEQHLHWYYLLGWGFPLVPVSIHAVARKKYFDDNCWMSVETHLLYAVHGPIVAALLVNLFFLLNIIRVLVTKLRDTHRAESNMYMKAVRATLILVPLLGIQFVIFPWRPENRLAGEVYEYVMHILMHYQGLLVATIFCFFNGEVQAALKRQWMQYKTQWGQRRKDHCSMRSTSYTATSITEVPAFMYHHDTNTEHLNGRHTEDSELVALKSGDTYA